jgi:hypothetical protein
MERRRSQRRPYITASLLVLIVGGATVISQNKVWEEPQQNIEAISSKFRIVHCWRYDQTDTGVSCKKTLNSCGSGWEEGYPPHPKKCPG